MRRVMEAAYAKVNLTLTVTGRRADGYHTIESLFQSVSLCDKLTLEQRERGFWLNETAGIPAEENIITRADGLLRRECPALGGVAVTLEKNIPTQAGLGGGDVQPIRTAQPGRRGGLPARDGPAVRTGPGP